MTIGIQKISRMNKRKDSSEIELLSRDRTGYLPVLKQLYRMERKII